MNLDYTIKIQIPSHANSYQLGDKSLLAWETRGGM